MNILAALPFLFFTMLCSAQKRSDFSVVHITLNARYRPLNVTILKDHVQILTTEINTLTAKYKRLEPGLYSFVIRDEQGRVESNDSIVVITKDALLEIELNAPCLYERPADYVPLCPKNHTDNIIPIFYGLLVQHKDDSPVAYQEYYPGGCLVTDCDPKFFCKLHGTRF